MNPDSRKPAPDSVPQRNKAVRILAKSLFRELTAQGYDERQIVNLATELISEVTTTMAAKSGQD
jgi:hypothetical protein